MSRPSEPLAFRPEEETVTVPLVLKKGAAEALLDISRRGEFATFVLSFAGGKLTHCRKEQTFQEGRRPA